MATFFTVVLWALLGLAAIVVALFVTPVWLYIRLATAPTLTYRVDAVVFGRLLPRFAIADSAKRRVSASKKQTAKHRKKKRSQSRKGAIRIRRVVSALPLFIADIFHAIHVVYLRLDLEYGFDDPADTGQLAGILMPIQYGPAFPPAVSVSMRPSFEHACLNGEIAAAVRITAAAFVAPALRFMWRIFGPVR